MSRRNEAQPARVGISQEFGTAVGVKSAPVTMVTHAYPFLIILGVYLEKDARS
jgi:hypothetical protein